MKHYSVLMVDDDKEFLEEFAPILVDSGFDVHTAMTAAAARKIAKEIQPALVLMDKKLPDGDGQTVIKEIRLDSKDSHFMIITAYAGIESVVKGLRDGISDYIIKPTNPVTLMSQIFKVLQKHQEKDADTEKFMRLTKKNEELQRLNALKSQFVANVSHELIGPLTVVKDAVDLAKEKCPEQTDHSAFKFLDICEREIDRLLHFTKNMLDLSKIESGKMPFNRTNVNMQVLISEVAELYAPEFDKGQIRLKVDLKNLSQFASLDADLMKEVLHNLVGNALKHSSASQTVTVSAFGEGDHLRIEVQDEGPGIPKEFQPKIFDKYYRIFADKTEGTGLGLAIVKEIIDMHNGKIWVESNGEKGTKFKIFLPLENIQKKEAL